MAPLNLHKSLTQNVRLRSEQGRRHFRLEGAYCSSENVNFFEIRGSHSSLRSCNPLFYRDDGNRFFRRSDPLVPRSQLDNFNFNNTPHASPRCAPRGADLFTWRAESVCPCHLPLFHGEICDRQPEDTPLDDPSAELARRSSMCFAPSFATPSFCSSSNAMPFTTKRPAGLSMSPSKDGSPTVVMMPSEKPVRSMSKVFTPLPAEERAAAIPAQQQPQTNTSV